jgi:hypothetical protein
VRIAVGQQVGFEVAREHRPVAVELAEHVAPEARVRLEEVARPRICRRALPPHPGANERQVLARPDEGGPLEELSLVPDQPVELGRIEVPDPVEQNKVLGPCHGRDRIHLQKPEPAHDLQHARCAAVERLCTHRDAARLRERDGD